MFWWKRCQNFQKFVQNAIASSNYLNALGFLGNSVKKRVKTSQIYQNFRKNIEKIMKFDKKCEIVRKTAKIDSGEVQKNANLVDLEKC